VGVRRFEDLQCWQLSVELKRGVYALVARAHGFLDPRFRTQLTDAVSSAPRNIAEGFGAYKHKESARYARIAKASLSETQDELLDGIDRGHWNHEDVRPLMVLAKRALGATVGWIRHLSTTQEPPAYWENEEEDDEPPPKHPGT
jgi:four helix bundle protein